MNKEEEKFRYKDREERYRKMNLFVYIGAMVLLLVFLVYLFMKVKAGSMNAYTAYGNIVLIIVFILINNIAYFRGKNKPGYKLFICVEFGIAYLLMAVQTDTEFITFAIIGILGACIPYYEEKFNRILSVSYGAIYLLGFIIRCSKGVYPLTIETACEFIIVMLVIYTLMRSAGIGKLFMKHALGAAEQQQEKQKGMLTELIDVSRQVQQESAKSGDMIEKLHGSTEEVNASMKRITSASEEIGLNIYEQNDMTTQIQTAIADTAERSGEMVKVAEASNGHIEESIKVMDELQSQSAYIAGTNSQVTDAMGRLQAKTKEVEEILAMIFSISSQTNMLALNASIEAARAGEAGKGFAVVAEQIRRLAEQTRTSTESIRQLIADLNNNSDEVVEAVGKSVEATGKQGEIIEKTASSFQMLEENITSLITDIKTINDKIGELTDANQNIVDNVSKLAANVEEVEESAEQAADLCSESLVCASDTKDSVGRIKTAMTELEEYL